MMKKYLTVAEAAVLVRRGKATIYRWIEAGDLLALDTDRGLEVRADEVQQVAASKRPGRPRASRARAAA